MSVEHAIADDKKWWPRYVGKKRLTTLCCINSRESRRVSYLVGVVTC